MDEKALSAIRNSFLFRSCTEDASFLLERCGAYEEICPPHHVIPFRGKSGGRIGILLEGAAKVFSAEDEKTLLNRLEEGDLFGVSTLYSEAEADTVIQTATRCRILFLEERNLGPLWEHEKTRENLVSFLTGRIRFLTEKIASFTAPDADTKLVRFLLQNSDEKGCFSVRSYSELAKVLNVGRASLYRSLDKLENEGVISRTGKEIRILQKERLKLLSGK